jgi:hypothetical protein
MIKSRIFILASLIVLSAFFPAPVVSMAKGAQGQLQSTQVWDTQASFAGEVNLADRVGWKVIDSSKSDQAPYTFQGDAVVENQHVTVAFCSGRGRVSIYAKADSNAKRVEFVPLELKGKPAKITDCTLLRNTGDEKALEVSFSGPGPESKLSAVFSFGGREIVAIEPAKAMKGISLLSTIEYGVVPGFLGDDLVFEAREYPATSALHVPCDSLFVGLLKGRNDMLVVTWPAGAQKMTLVPDNQAGDRLVESVDFDNDGTSIYLALLHAPNIWHKEELKPAYLEKDVTMDWTRPFPAKWKTQLLEAGVKTTFGFRESRKEIWRAAIGYYVYPVWFEGDKAYFHLGKKIPPRGDSLIYYLEGTGASGAHVSAVDILKETLDRETCDRKLAWRGRKPLDLVRPVSPIDSHDSAKYLARGRAVATCAVTQNLTSIFEAGAEVARRDEVKAGVEDMVYFIAQHRKRIETYMDFARDMEDFLKRAGQNQPDLRPFLGQMEAIAQEIPQEYDRVKDTIRDLDYAAQLARQTEALAREKSPNNLKAFTDLGQKWRAMGGAQDDLIRVFHTTTRKLFQKTGYGCADVPDALEIAREIRKRCQECLSNPSSYEIWADY